MKDAPDTTPLAHPLTPEMLARYAAWHRGAYQDESELYGDLVDHGQHPETMVISCCDSRVNPTAIFGAHPGDYFVHRNIANYVPTVAAAETAPGTAAAVEYAVSVLKVKHLVIIGHSNCGGVKGCYDICEGRAPALEDRSSFVGRWVRQLSDTYQDLPEGDEPARLQAFEKAAVATSLRNLASYAFVAAAIAAGELQLHGLWNDIAAGTLEYLDSRTGRFRSVE